MKNVVVSVVSFIVSFFLACFITAIFMGIIDIAPQELKFQKHDHGGHVYIYSRYSSGYFLHAPDCPCFSKVEAQP